MLGTGSRFTATISRLQEYLPVYLDISSRQISSRRYLFWMRVVHVHGLGPYVSTMADCWFNQAGCWLDQADYWLDQADCWLDQADCWFDQADCWFDLADCWFNQADCWFYQAGCWFNHGWLLVQSWLAVGSIMADCLFNHG